MPYIQAALHWVLSASVYGLKTAVESTVGLGREWLGTAGEIVDVRAGRWLERSLPIETVATGNGAGGRLACFSGSAARSVTGVDFTGSG